MSAVHLALVRARNGADLASLAARLAAHPAGTAAQAVLLSPTLPGHIAGGDLVWRLGYADRDAWAASAPDRAALDDGDIAHVDWIAFEAVGAGRRAPTPANGVYRQMTMHVPAAAPPDAVAAFEAEMLGLADRLPVILRWTLGRAFASGGDRPWTHVWEQEFADLADFRGAYMSHPWHWARVDRWFDPEMPERIVDRRLCNGLCRLVPDPASFVRG